jgi:hypothetical protein
MTEKEEAMQLYNKFLEIGLCQKHAEYVHDGNICQHIAKKCAIINVDEIIRSLLIVSKWLRDKLDHNEIRKDIEYYERVKQEIEKL